MKELKFMNAQLNGILRVSGKTLFFKYSDSTYANQVINEMRKKGAIITKSPKGDWVMVDIFKEIPVVKLGDIEIDFENDKKEEIEDKLIGFYSGQYKKMGFKVDISGGSIDGITN